MIENATKVFDFIFHWAGVWLVMNAITEGAYRFMDWMQVRLISRTAERLGRGARRLTISLQAEAEQDHTDEDTNGVQDGEQDADGEQETDPEKQETGSGENE